MSILEFLSQPLFQRLGMTLVHFLWQGLAVAVLISGFIKVFRLKHGNARYVAYLLAFIGMIICPVVTFTAIDRPTEFVVMEAEFTEVVDSVSYTALPADNILPEIDISRPVTPTPVAIGSIPLHERISNWLDISIPWILAIWMIGVSVLSVRLLMGFAGVYRWRRHLKPLPERLAQRIVSLSEGLGMRGFSRVFISPSVLQAMAVGYLRPMVLLPVAMLTQMQPEMLEAVIAHELAHIRRFDLWINLVQRVTETLLFYHPAVWWLSNCLRSERELCCDELAVKATGERITYATTLESVSRTRFMAKQPVIAAGLGQDNKPTLSRIRHILGLAPTQRNCPFWLAGVIAVLFLAALVIPTTLALTHRQDEKPEDLERAVVEGICANRDKFECGILAWSRKIVDTRYEDPRGNQSGQHELWWDGKKMATKYLKDEVYNVPSGGYRVRKQQGGNSYDGGILSRKPDFRDDNWLGPNITRWRGMGSEDELIRQDSKQENISKDWSVVITNGVKLVKLTTRYMNEKDTIQNGNYSVGYYDPAKGYGLVKRESYDANGSRGAKRTVKLLEVIPGGWFPVEFDFKSFAITDGRLIRHNHYALDMEQCSFNDRSALPRGIFKLGMEKQLKYQEKLQKYLAMELEGLSDVKEAAKADMVKLGAREAIEEFVAAALAGDLEKAAEYAHPDRLPANQITEITEIAKGQNLWIMAVVADDLSAIAVSSVIRGDHDRTGPLVFSLDRVSQDGRDNWWVHDIDMETPDGAEGELKRFLEKHPEAEKIPSLKEPDVQVESDFLATPRTKRSEIRTGFTASDYKATLPNGVVVELIGVCEHPSEGKQWWRPDGSKLKESPYDDDFGRAFPKDGEKGYKFAVKFGGMARKEMDAKIRLTNFRTTNGGSLFSTSKKNGEENIKYVDNSLDEKIVWMGAAFDETLNYIDVKVGVCFGDWKQHYKYETDHNNDMVEWTIFKNISLEPKFKTDVQVEAKPVPRSSSKSRTAIVASDYKATLPNGVNVDLLAVYYGTDFDDFKVWYPDGSLLPKEKINDLRNKIVFPEWGNEDLRFEYGLIFRFNPFDNLHTDVFVKQGEPIDYSYFSTEGIGVPLVARDIRLQDKFSGPGNIKVATAYGKWETRKFSGINEVATRYFDEKSMIMFSPVRKENGCLLDITINSACFDINCYYELKNGSVHSANYDGTISHPNWIGPDQRTPMITKQFTLFHEPEKIKNYIIKYRKFEIAEFKNVALKPKFKPDVQVDSEVRIIRFPKDRSMGTLSIGRRDPMDSVWWGEFTKHGPAKGDVQVPVGQDLYLAVGKDASKDITPLGRLQPDDIQVISFTVKGGGSSINDEALKNLSGLTGLRHLSLGATQIKGQGLKHLSKLQSLEVLSVNRTNLDDDAVKHIAKLKSLKRLALDDTLVTDTGISYLNKLKSLEKLTLYRTGITGEGFSNFSGNSSLREVLLNFSDITDDGLAHLSNLRSLEKLSLYNTGISDKGLVHLRDFNSLRELNLEHTEITDAGMEYLAELTLLEELWLPDGVTDKGLAKLNKLTGLKWLDISYMPLTGKGLKVLGNFKQLEFLDFPVGVVDDDLGVLKELTSLKQLWIQNSPITNKGLANLKPIGSLKELLLLSGDDDMKMDVTCSAFYNVSPALTYLNISGIELDQTRLKSLSRFTQLEKLEMDGMPLRDDDLASLANLRKLKTLFLRSDTVSDGGIAHLANLTSMEDLAPSVAMTDEGLKYFSRMKNLDRLQLNGDFTDEGLKHLESLKSLSTLRISTANNISLESRERLKKALPFLRTLHVIKKTGVNPRPELGQAAPSFTCKSLDGKELQLSDYRGKVVLLHFWATWCSPCVASTPALKQFHKELSRYKDFAMISFSLDDDDFGVRQHVRRNGLSWPQVRLGHQSQIGTDYGVKGVPAYILVDPEGKILISRGFDWGKIEEAVAEELGKQDMVEVPKQKPDVQVDKYQQMLEPLNRQRQELDRELESLREAYDDTEHLAGVRLTVSNAELETVGWFRKRHVASSVVRCEIPAQLLQQSGTAIWPDSFEVHTARTAAYLKERDFLQDVIRRDKVRRTKWFQVRKKDTEKAIDSLADSLAVQVKDTADIEVKFIADEPADAQAILDELLQLFILQQTDRARNELTKKMADLREEKSKLKRSIQFMEDEKQTLRREAQETQEPGVSVDDPEMALSGLEDALSNGAEYDIKTITTIMDAYEKQIDSIKLKYSYESFADKKGDQYFMKGSFAQNKSEGYVLLDEIKQKGKTWENDKINNGIARSFNGQITRYLEHEQNKHGYHVASLHENHNPDFYKSRDNPYYRVWHINYKNKFTDLLNDPDGMAKIQGEELVNGLKTIKINFRFAENLFDCHLWLLPEKNYLPIKFTSHRTTDGSRQEEMHWSEFKEFADGIWYPMEIKMYLRNIDNPSTIKIEEMDISPLTKEDFEFEFPEFTHVTDHIAGTSYLTTTIE